MFSQITPLDVDDLAAGHAVGGLAARHVVRVAVVDVLVAGLGLGLVEGERAGADVGLDLLVRVGLRLLLAHDPAQRRAGLGQGIEDQSVGLAQRDREGPLILGRDVLDPSPHVLAGAVLFLPAEDRGDAVVGGDRAAIAEAEAVTQLERPGQLVVRHAVVLDHLWLRVEVAVDAEQRVVDHRPVVGGDVGRGPDRVEHPKVAVHHGLDGARSSPLRPGHPGGPEPGESCGCETGLEDGTPGRRHVSWPPCCSCARAIITRACRLPQPHINRCGSATSSSGQIGRLTLV
jgi:hypothetical protein